MRISADSFKPLELDQTYFDHGSCTVTRDPCFITWSSWSCLSYWNKILTRLQVKLTDIVRRHAAGCYLQHWWQINSIHIHRHFFNLSSLEAPVAEGVCRVFFTAPGGGVSGLLVCAHRGRLLHHLIQFNVWCNIPQSGRKPADTVRDQLQGYHVY